MQEPRAQRGVRLERGRNFARAGIRVVEDDEHVRNRRRPHGQPLQFLQHICRLHGAPPCSPAWSPIGPNGDRVESQSAARFRACKSAEPARGRARPGLEPAPSAARNDRFEDGPGARPARGRVVGRSESGTGARRLLAETRLAAIVHGIASWTADVTRRSDDDRELRARAEHFARLVQSSPDLILVIDTGGYVTFASAAVSTFGYAADDLVNSSIFDVIHPEDAPGALDALSNAVVDFEPEMIPLRVRHADGHWVPVEALGSDLFDDPLVNGLLVNVRDVSDRVEIAETLREVQVRSQQAWEHAPIGMAFTDRDGNFFKVNPALGRLLGCTEDDLLESGLAMRSHPDDVDRSLAFHRSLFGNSRGGAQWEQRLLRHDESSVWVRVSATIVRANDDEPLYGLVQLEDITHVKQSRDQLTYDATHDALTGLPLRKLVFDHLELALAGARRNGSEVAVLFVDLDHFKPVNDSLGHGAGDELLAEVAARLRNAVRGGDTPGRFGGDEFVVVCPGLTAVRDVVVVAERVRALLAKPFRIRGRDVFIGASIGIAVAAGDATPESLLRDADSAAYRAKQRGRNRFEIFDDELRDSVAQRLEVENGVRRGLERDEFRVLYQPIVDAGSGRLAGFEALVRWDDPDRGLLRPSEFLAIAEETGLVVPLGRRVLTDACEQLARWQSRDEHDAPFVTVNVSPRQLLAAELVDDIGEIIAAAGVSPGRLWIEIPETLLVHDTPQLVALLRELGGFGIELALDDFGTGYSSLNHLRDLPVSVLKIDSSFIAEIGKTTQDATIVGSVINLAHALGMRVIAEGVETEEQLDILRLLDCDLVQGYLFARPLYGHDADALINAAPWESPHS